MESIILHFDSKAVYSKDDLIEEDTHYFIMQGIQKEINFWDPEEVLLAAKYYSHKVSLLKDLVQIHLNEINEVKKEDKGKVQLKSSHLRFVESVKGEVDYFFNTLSKIITPIENYHLPELDTTKSINHNITINEIVLPEGFSAGMLQKHFDPHFSADEVALFLTLLKSQSIIAPYEPSNLAKLTWPLFGRHSREVQKSFSKIHELKESKTFLTALSDKILGLNRQIDDYLKEAR